MVVKRRLAVTVPYRQALLSRDHAAARSTDTALRRVLRKVKDRAVRTDIVTRER